jgi:hypothetical protein
VCEGFELHAARNADAHMNATLADTGWNRADMGREG